MIYEVELQHLLALDLYLSADPLIKVFSDQLFHIGGILYPSFLMKSNHSLPVAMTLPVKSP